MQFLNSIDFDSKCAKSCVSVRQGSLEFRFWYSYTGRCFVRRNFSLVRHHGSNCVFLFTVNLFFKSSLYATYRQLFSVK